MTDLWLHPEVEHRLAAVVRFLDVFTGARIAEPLEVRVVGQPDLQGVYGSRDATYRFFTTNEAVPVLGPVDLEVVDVGDPPMYRSEEAVSVTIPPLGPPPTPLTFDHFLSEHPLWPTRSFRPPTGETAIRGRLIDPAGPVAGATVAIAPDPMPAGTVVAHTDADGDFVYRLPGVRTRTIGDVVTTTATLQIAVRDSTNAIRVVASPALPTIVPIARTASLTITLT